MVKPERSLPLLDCSAVESNLTAYLKGGLDTVWEEAIRFHLLRCETCAHVVQEARELDAALYAAAPRRPAQLPPQLSDQVQEDVYRRMRRALVFQRTRALTGRVITVVVSLAFIVALGLMVGPWLRYLAVVEATPAPPLVASQGPAQLPAAIPDVQTVQPGALPVEYHSPADSARALIEAAVAGDDGRVEQLLLGTRTRAARVRARLEPCRGALDTSQIRYSTVRYDSTVAGVRIHYGGQLAGEVKLLLRENGYWYLHYLHYDSFNSILGRGCLALP
jgi:hypothetical protein